MIDLVIVSTQVHDLDEGKCENGYLKLLSVKMKFLVMEQGLANLWEKYQEKWESVWVAESDIMQDIRAQADGVKSCEERSWICSLWGMINMVFKYSRIAMHTRATALCKRRWSRMEFRHRTKQHWMRENSVRSQYCHSIIDK